MAKPRSNYTPPPNSQCQLEGYRRDQQESIWVVATLMLATRAVGAEDGAEDEDSLEELAMAKFSVASLDPVETRKLRNRKSQQELAV